MPKWLEAVLIGGGITFILYLLRQYWSLLTSEGGAAKAAVLVGTIFLFGGSITVGIYLYRINSAKTEHSVEDLTLLSVSIIDREQQKPGSPRVAFRPSIIGKKITVIFFFYSSQKRIAEKNDHNSPAICLNVWVNNALVANKFANPANIDSDDTKLPEGKKYRRREGGTLTITFVASSLNEHEITIEDAGWFTDCRLMVVQAY